MFHRKARPAQIRLLQEFGQRNAQAFGWVILCSTKVVAFQMALRSGIQLGGRDQKHVKGVETVVESRLEANRSTPN